MESFPVINGQPCLFVRVSLRKHPVCCGEQVGGGIGARGASASASASAASTRGGAVCTIRRNIGAYTARYATARINGPLHGSVVAGTGAQPLVLAVAREPQEVGRIDVHQYLLERCVAGHAVHVAHQQPRWQTTCCDTMSTSTILGFTDLGDRVISQALPSEEDGAHVSLRRPGAVPVCTWYETDRTVAAVRAGAYKRVALQFPDHLLRDAPAVVALLQDGLSETGARVFVLGDTSFAACCVDEVAAAVRALFMLL